MICIYEYTSMYIYIFVYIVDKQWFSCIGSPLNPSFGNSQSWVSMNWHHSSHLVTKDLPYKRMSKCSKLEILQGFLVSSFFFVA